MRPDHVLILIVLAISVIVPGGQLHAAQTTAIADVTLIDGTGVPPVAHATVFISGARITDIRTGGSGAVTADEIVDGTGKFLIPGLWDMHTHLSYVGDVTCTVLVAHGVTSVRDMGGSLETVDWLHNRIEAGTLIGPRIFRAGPLIDGSKPGSPDRLVVDTADDGRDAVGFMKARGVDFIKVHNGTPPAAYFAILAEADRQGLAVAGHIPYAVDPARAIDAGHQSIEHIVSLFEGPVRQKTAAGMSQEQAIAEFTDAEAVRLARRMVDKGTWLDPTLVTYWFRAHQWDARARDNPREKYVTESMRENWNGFESLPDDPDLRRTLTAGFDRFVEITRIAHQQGVRLLVGTDLAAPLIHAGSTVHDELGWLVRAGLTPMEAISAGTRNGAEAMGRSNDLGTIEEGKLADLVLLDASPLADIANTQSIAAVMVNGRLFRRAALDALLAEVANDAGRR